LTLKKNMAWVQSVQILCHFLPDLLSRFLCKMIGGFPCSRAICHHGSEPSEKGGGAAMQQTENGDRMQEKENLNFGK
jgi:hypothetical protein